MKRSFTFFVLMLVVCGLFYFQKTKTQKENQALVQGIVRLKEVCDEHLKNVVDKKKDCNSKLEDLKSEVDKKNEMISQNENKIKNLSANPRNRYSVSLLQKKNDELKGFVSEKNSEIELLNAKIDNFSNAESSLNDWKQKAFDILEKTQNGNLSKDDKLKINTISDEFTNVEKIVDDTLKEQKEKSAEQADQQSENNN